MSSFLFMILFLPALFFIIWLILYLYIIFSNKNTTIEDKPISEHILKEREYRVDLYEPNNSLLNTIHELHVYENKLIFIETRYPFPDKKHIFKKGIKPEKWENTNSHVAKGGKETAHFVPDHYFTYYKNSFNSSITFYYDIKKSIYHNKKSNYSSPGNIVFKTSKNIPH